MPVVRINEFQAAADRSPALHAFLHAVIGAIKEAPGCREVSLLTDHDDPSRFVIVESWDSIAAHQAAAARIPPEKMAEVKPLLGAPPKGRYYDSTP